MSDNIPRIDQEDLLRNVFGGSDSNYSSGYSQENGSVEQDGSDILNDANIPAIPLIDPALLPLFNPSIYQNHLARNDPRHFGHLAVPQTQPPRWQQSPSASGTVCAIHGVHHNFGAAQVEDPAQAWYGNATTNTGYLNLQQPDTYQDPFSVDEAGLECGRTYNMTLHRPPQHESWTCNETDALQNPSGRDPGFPDLHSPPWDTGMEVVQQQGQVPQAVMGNLGEASDLYSFSNIDLHDPDLASAYSSAAPSRVAVPQPTAPPSKSVVCPFCKRQLQDRPGLRHHLDIHDPAKASRYKCGHGTCTYASRYPKDVVRHNLTHVKPVHYRFVCPEPDCDGKFHRNDYLLRHCRKAHSSPSEAGGARSSRRRAPGQNNLTVPRQRRSRATSASSSSIRNGGASSTGSRRVMQRTLRTPVQPSKVSLRLSSVGASTNPTHGDSSFALDNSSLWPTPQTADSCFHEYLDPRLLSPISPSDSFYYSATGSPCPQ